jgi:hypothetical protein
MIHRPIRPSYALPQTTPRGENASSKQISQPLTHHPCPASSFASMSCIVAIFYKAWPALCPEATPARLPRRPTPARPSACAHACIHATDLMICCPCRTSGEPNRESGIRQERSGPTLATLIDAYDLGWMWYSINDANSQVFIPVP